MVLKKRQEYGFYGYLVPVIPRAPRSLRRRVSIKKSVHDGQICAFELLAAVAGKLLQESESSVSSNAAEGKQQLGIHKDGNKKEQVEGKAVRSDCLDQGSCIKSVLVSESAALEHTLKSSLKELTHFESDFGCTSVVSSSDLLKKVGCDVKLEKYTSNNAVGSIPSKAEGSFHSDGKLYNGNLGKEAERQVEVVGKWTGHLNVANTGGSKDPMELYVNNTNLVIDSESSIKFPLCRAHVPNAPFPGHRNDVKIVNRDDDENYFRHNQLNNKIRAFRPRSRTGYRRIRKVLTSKYWKAAPKLKECEVSNTGRGGRPFYHKRKTIYARERCQHEVHSKRRRLGDQRTTVAYDQEASSESISNSPEKAMKGDKRATGVSSSGVGHKASFQSADPCVKLSIKSFKVPELYIEVPETATVGSLKRTVMEAVTAILGGGLRVGVVLQGKKVRDDNRTLQQTGISQNEDLETLGFTLEPSIVQVASPLSHKDPPLLLPCETHQQSSRSPAPILDSGFSNTSFDPAPVTNLDNHVESSHEIVPSLTDVSTEGMVPDSKALVAIPQMSAEALAMVPVNPKTKRSEISQRRTRRPFSVSEVEALVEAVEKLGTGRWRDVKMRAFDDANHRTYVDLKDKWKTLVHTASIAPQQRRGEPVPQELLGRVLGAHAYWSRHQSKQHGKHPIDHLKLAGEIGV